MADNFETLDIYMFRRVCVFGFVVMVYVIVAELFGDDMMIFVKERNILRKLGL